MLIARNIAQYPLHHVTYAPAEFKVATSNGLGGDAFTGKSIIWPDFVGQGHAKYYPVPCKSWDLWTCNV